MDRLELVGKPGIQGGNVVEGGWAPSVGVVGDNELIGCPEDPHTSFLEDKGRV